jgi:hypothetical protein
MLIYCHANGAGHVCSPHIYVFQSIQFTLNVRVFKKLENVNFDFPFCNYNSVLSLIKIGAIRVDLETIPCNQHLK